MNLTPGLRHAQARPATVSPQSAIAWVDLQACALVQTETSLMSQRISNVQKRPPLADT